MSNVWKLGFECVLSCCYGRQTSNMALSLTILVHTDVCTSQLLSADIRVLTGLNQIALVPITLTTGRHTTGRTTFHPRNLQTQGTGLQKYWPHPLLLPHLTSPQVLCASWNNRSAPHDLCQRQVLEHTCLAPDVLLPDVGPPLAAACGNGELHMVMGSACPR